ncbi:MAG TPA: hypothetical protein V6D47_02710 [Oscillatoriaceae cyanobacterium]
MPRYEAFEDSGYTFVFKYDEAFPEMLHYHVRHWPNTIDDAIDTFFADVGTWDERHQRFISQSDTHELLWYWIDETKKVVMVISCYRI